VTADRLVLWRHGRTSYNHDNRWQGQLDVPLDDVGHAQAKAGAVAIAASFDGGPVRVVSSDLARAADTAAALGLPVSLDEGLREVFAGTWQGLLRDEIVARWPDELAAWRRGDDVRPGGGESRSEVAERSAAAMRRAAEDLAGGTLVVVGHGAALRSGMTLLLGLPSSGWTTFDVLGNARWADLRRRRSGWALRAYNAAAPGRADLEADPAGQVDSRPVPGL
jgi:glucosyl-3-phosphoglycerate phosphatase